MRTYRGKYPHNIREVYGDKGFGLVAVTNSGFRYRIVPTSPYGSAHTPAPNIAISRYVQSGDYRVYPLDGDVINARGQ